MDDYDNPPPARQVGISENNLDQVLAAHQKWLNSRPQVGMPGNLANIDMYGMDLSNKDLRYVQLQGSCLRKTTLRNLRGAQLGSADLVGANLVGAYAREAVFSDADLTYANLRGADLKRARFSNSNLIGAVFRDADLQDATFAGAKGILAEQFAGANVSGTDLPDAVKGFESLKIADEASKNCRKLHFTLIAACAYCWLTIATTTDTNILLNSASLSLPIIGSRIPIVGFYCIAPILLFTLYVYFNLNLQRLWEVFAQLPSVFPDGCPLDKKTFPWLLNGLVRNFSPRLQAERPALFWVQTVVAMGIAWWVVPITLCCFWIRSITRHSWPLTAFLSALAIIALFSGYKFSELAKASLQGHSLPRFTFRGFWKGPRQYLRDIGVFLVSCLPLIVVSYGAMEGVPPDVTRAASNPRSYLPRHEPWNPMVWVPQAMQRLGYRPFAEFPDTDLSEKPANWGAGHEETSSVKGARLGNTKMPYAFGTKAFMVNADLQYSNLQGAILQNADARGANFENSKLSSTDFYGADLRHADFMGADLTHTWFGRANVAAANFQHVKGLTVPQIRAMENWQQGIFDNEMSETLGLNQIRKEAASPQNTK